MVTSNVWSMPEVAGTMHRVLTDGALGEDLVRRGLEWAGLFSWERTARETLAVYQRVMGISGP